MNIKAIRLQNFRGFHDAAIELKPLTVLLGPNSAGKSSFGHALATMSHAHRIFAGTPQATLTPSAKDVADWPIDLGNLSDLRTEGAGGPVKIELKTSAGLLTFGFGLESVTGLLPSYFLFPKGEESAGKTVPPRKEANSIQDVRASSAAQTVTEAPKPSEGVAQSSYYEVRRLNRGQWKEGEFDCTCLTF